MKKCNWFLLFMLITGFSFGQKEITDSYGIIKIVKINPDSVYIKAEMDFRQFQEGNKSSDQTVSIRNINIIAPSPKVSGYSIPFDFNQFCNKKIEVKKKDLSNKVTDTVRIQIKVLDNGKVYFKDLTPLMMLNGVPAYYDKKKNAYKLDAIHWKCLNVLKQIKHWEPAYIIVGEKGSFKKMTVIKPKKKKLAATGVLTIIFSTVPFEKKGSDWN